MRKRTLLTRLASGVVVVAVTAASTLLVSNAAANADPPPGTLGSNTVAPDVGTNLSLMHSTTSGACPDPSTRADLTVVGPIGVPANQQVFPPSNPFTAVTPTDTQFSTTGPFVQQWRASFHDAVAERGLTAVPVGEYDFTTSCLPRFGSNNFGTYVGGLFFDTPTTYYGLPKKEISTYVTFYQTAVPKNLTTTQLQTIFQKTAPCSRKPRVPVAGSGVRKFWDELVGPFSACVDTTNTIPENNGTIVGVDPNVIAPYSISEWIAQTTDPRVPDVHGGTVPRAINGVSPYQAFPTSINLIKMTDGTLQATLNPANVTGVMQLCMGTPPNCTPVGAAVGTPPNVVAFPAPTTAGTYFVRFTDPTSVWAQSNSNTQQVP